MVSDWQDELYAGHRELHDRSEKYENACIRSWSSVTQPIAWMLHPRPSIFRGLALAILAIHVGPLVGGTPAESYLSSFGVALAQESTPAAGVSANCTIEPRPARDFIAVDEESNDALSLMLGTPIATPIPPVGGVPADPAIVSEVTQTMEELTACVNAADLRRLSALFTDEQFQRMYGGIGKQMLESLGTPTALPEGIEAPEVSIQDVLLLPDGRVSAITEANGDRALTIFKMVDNRYLIDFSYLPPPSGTPVP